MSNRIWTPIKQYQDILFEQYKSIAKITINRPEVYNAFRPTTNFEMLDAIDAGTLTDDIYTSPSAIAMLNAYVGK